MSAARTPRIAGAVPIVVAALLGCTRLGSLDLPLMLANGEWILSEGAIPRTNVFSWVNPGHPYLNDKWAFMVLVAAVDRVGGTAGLAVLKMGLSALLGGLLHLLARRSLPPWRAAGVACLAVSMVAYRLNLRAEWLTYVGIATTLLLLPGVLAGRRRAVLGQVALMPLWAAVHGYWFLGPAIVWAAAVGSRSRRGGVVGVACIGAAALSPYGVHNVLHPLGLFRHLGGPLGGAVSELRAPFSGDGPTTIYHVLAAVITLAAGAAVFSCAGARRLDRALVISLLVAAAWKVDRNLGLLGLTVPLSAAAVPVLAASLPWGGAAALVIVGGTALGVPRIAGDRMFGLGEHPDRFPVQLLDGLPDAWAGERYINDFSLGSWLVQRRGTAFIDGNAEGYPPEFYARYRAVLAGELPAAELEAELAPDGWLLRTSAPQTRLLVLWMFVSGDHAPARWDTKATLFRTDLEPEQATEAWRTWLHDVYLPQARAWYVPAEDAERMARDRLAIEHRDDEVAVLRAALQLQPWSPELYGRLAVLYDARGDVRAAGSCRRWAYVLKSP